MNQRILKVIPNAAFLKDMQMIAYSGVLEISDTKSNKMNLQKNV